MDSLSGSVLGMPEIHQLKKWKECILAVRNCSDVVCMHRDVENGCDVIFPDIDGDSFDDVREHWKPGSIVQMSIPMLFNMRNEIFSSDLDVSFKALQGLDGIEIVRDVDQILVTLIDQEFSGPSAG